ncbi:hypothetical protein ACLESD_13395 [Pyxidicoccus sp. 3LFB2]
MAAKTYDLYGIKEGDLAELSQALAPVLGVRFVLHDSDYLGGSYYRAELQGGVIKLQVNYLPFTKDWAEAEYKEYGMLLRVDAVQGADALRAAIEQGVAGTVVWLRRVVLENGRKVLSRKE